MQNVAKSVPRQSSIVTPTSSAESSTEEQQQKVFRWCLYQKLGVAKVIHQVQDQGDCRENRIRMENKSVMSKFEYRRKTSAHMTSTGKKKNTINK